jgi:hypothetical protein
MSNIRVNANIQEQREVHGTRVKDEFYIFTGTYPLYYKGDGNLYLLPEHDTTFVEQVVSGNNTLMADFENNYYPNLETLTFDDVSEINNSPLEDLDFRIIDFKFTPKLPFERDEETNERQKEQLQIKAIFSIPDVLFDLSPMSDITVEIFQRASLPGSRELNYERVGYSARRFVNALTETNLGSRLLLNSAIKSQISNIVFEADIGNVPVGLRDILLVFKTRNPLQVESDPNDDFIQDRIEINEITFSITKIQNYPTDAEPTKGGFTLKAPWSCNHVIEHYGQLIAWGSTSMPNTVFISNNLVLNYFPYLYTFTFETDENEAINSIVPYMNILVVQSDSYTWGIKGTNPLQFLDNFAEVPNPNAYQPFSINTSVGSIAPKAVRPIRNRLYFLSQEGMMELTSLFATDDRYNVRPLDRNIRNLIPQDREAVGIQFDNQYWLSLPSTGEMFRYYIDKESWVKDTFNFNEFNGFYKFYNRDGKLHMITHPLKINAGIGNYRIFEVEVDTSLALDLGVPIKTRFLTSKMNQEFPFHWKRYKELKLDFSIQNEFLPKLESVEILNTDTTVPYTIEANFEPNHTYAIGLNLPSSYSVETEEYSYPPILNLLVENAISFREEDTVIYFTVGNPAPQEVTISFSGATIEMFNDIILTDETYNKNLNFNVRVNSDNKSLIRTVDIVNDDYKDVIPLVSPELGIMANVFEETFQNSKFGKTYKFVYTNKLYGSGYDLELYYEDDANVKWTLETIGVTHKMRRTRSR